jgi:alkylated DNA nucleotide flippase Atl1
VLRTEEEAMNNELGLIESELRSSKNQWRWKVTSLITEIPSGYLITYGELANCAKKEHGLNIQARNVAWLRKRLYGILGHDTEVPLHRIAKKGDVGSWADSEKTRSYNNRLRADEGSLQNPKWYRC